MQTSKDSDGAQKTSTSSVKWAYVAGLDAAKDALKEHVIVPLRFPQLFRGNRRPRGGILLYGAPGAGKTYIVKATATEDNNVSFFHVQSCDLVSKWATAGDKQIRHLFDIARQNKPSIIFIDDLEVAFGSGSVEAESGQQTRSELLLQMEGDNDDIIVMAASSTPWNIECGVRRRFDRRIYIGLPDQPEARVEIFKLNMGTTPHTLTENEFQELAQMTNGFSGSDIAVVVRDALMQPVREVTRATHFRKVSGPSPLDQDVVVNDHWTHCSPESPGAVEMDWANIPGDKLLQRAINMSDMMQSLSSMAPSITEEELEKLKKFTHDFCDMDK